MAGGVGVKITLVMSEIIRLLSFQAPAPHLQSGASGFFVLFVFLATIVNESITRNYVLNIRVVWVGNLSKWELQNIRECWDKSE